MTPHEKTKFSTFLNNFVIYYQSSGIDHVGQCAAEFLRNNEVNTDYLIVGQWYWLDNGADHKLLICFSSFSNYNFGFTGSGGWDDTIWFDEKLWHNGDYKPATKEEVEQRLFSEAKRRYPIGTTFSVCHMPDLHLVVKSHSSHPDTFVYNEDGLFLNLRVYQQEPETAAVYHDGKWAEIIEPAKDESTEMTISEIEQELGISNLKIVK